MLRRSVPQDISTQANVLYQQYSADDEFKAHKNAEAILACLRSISENSKIAPDDWALAQESLPAEHPCAKFFRRNRDHISRQLIIAGKKFTAVAIITFTHQGELYVLLMENIGLAASIREKEIQWTTHGVRVDELEYDLLKNKSLWDHYEKICNSDDKKEDKTSAYFVAATVRNIQDMGLQMTENQIKDIHLIDRVGAGFPEEDPAYRTEHLYVNLGERIPAEVMHACSSPLSTRYGHWTYCFKLSELQINVKDNAETEKFAKSYSFTYQDKTHPIRFLTWHFLKALQLWKKYELKPQDESLEEIDPWNLKDFDSIERALSWITNKADNTVQMTLFSDTNNKLSSPKLHAYAAKANLNVRDLAYTTLKPERLVLHAIIALLTIRIQIKNSAQLEKDASDLYKRFFILNPEILNQWDIEFSSMKSALNQLIQIHINSSEQELQNLSIEQQKDITEIKNLVAILAETKPDDRSQTIYHLYEDNLQIAVTIYLHRKYQTSIQPEILAKVDEMLMAEIASQKFQSLELYPLTERQCFAVTGPVASGKSVSEKVARKHLAGRDAAYISSDEWNNLLNANANLTGFAGYSGTLTLAEAWYIKRLIWDCIKKLENTGRAPNWIQEAISPLSIKIPALAETVIFLNTSNHAKAASRVKKRGEESGRYVVANVATESYRGPWLNFVNAIEKNKDMRRLSIKVMDTDIMHAPEYLHLSEEEREMRTNIATFSEGVLTIHNLQRFITFVQRSFKIPARPKNAEDIWQQSPSMPAKLLIEINKLFKLAVFVQYNGVNLSATDLYLECGRRSTAERLFKNLLTRKSANILRREAAAENEGRDPTESAGRDPTESAGRDPAESAGRDPAESAGRDPAESTRTRPS
jgi:hypothetical protein